MRKNLSKKEVLFCRVCTRLGQAREAAALVGYENPKQDSVLLLARPEIQEELQKKTSSTRTLALMGLEHLAFASCLDALKLCQHGGELSSEQWETLDLFCVSQIKKGKDGSLELSLYNRIDALKALLEYATDPQEQNNLLEALAKTVEMRREPVNED